jgi:hypothetical protein
MLRRLATPALILSLCLTGQTGCQTGQRQEPYRATPQDILGVWNQLQPGMTPEEVVGVLGAPTSMGIGAGMQEWEYSGYPGQRAPGYVRFRQQRVQRVDPPAFHQAVGGGLDRPSDGGPGRAPQQGTPTRPGRPARP